MPGMNRSLPTDNPTIVSAFHRALGHQLLFVLGLLLVLLLAFNVLRAVRGAHGEPASGASGADDGREPLARRVLRTGFGLFWVLDGLLQLQSAMPLGLPDGVVRPSAASAPGWVQSVVNAGIGVWQNHPVQAAAATVWIQVGLGLWLVVAPRGRWSQAAGVAGASWGLLVWIFGEAFGGLFSPGATWLFGFPGAALLYAVAGVLVALPEGAWRGPRLGRRLLAGLGLYFVAMAMLQAWPGRGFWQGHTSRGPGSLAAMVDSMAGTSQPHLFSSWVGSFAGFVTANGALVNAVAVVSLAAIGAALLTGRRRFVLAGTVGALVLCLADWVLVQDFGFFGGEGTDPNSMLPTALLVVVGAIALLHAPAPARVAATAPARTPAGAVTGWRSLPTGALFRVTAALGAFLIVVVGAAPMALATTNGTTDTVLDQALNGAPQVIDGSPGAPGFSLVDQYGRPVRLTDLRGRVVVLTFLDPVCTSDCPLIAQNMKLADEQLGEAARHVDFVAVVANPVYRSTTFTAAFDRQEGLEHLSNWLYLTGSTTALTRVWDDYSFLATVAPAGAMVSHDDQVVLIDRAGRERVAMQSDPGTDASYHQSFVSVLNGQIEQLLAS